MTADGRTDVLRALDQGDAIRNGAATAVDAELPLTELGMARRLVASFDGRVRYAPEIRAWFFYDGAVWQEDITGDVHRRAKAVIDLLHEQARFNASGAKELTAAWLKMQAASKIRAIVELATTEPGVPVLLKDFDSDPLALNVANGVVDLRTGELRAHDPAEMHSKIVPIDYEPGSEAPTWVKFLHEVFDGDGELIDFVQTFAGYSLSGDVTEQMLVFAHGTGANGKSTLLGMLRRLASGYGVQLDPTILIAGQHEQHPTGLTDLRGARLVTTIETEQGRKLAEALVKMLTGGDPIRARRMRMDYFEFEPSHHIWLAGNYLPNIRGTDLGIWRRIALVPFDVTFEGERQDPNLPAKLAAEAPGVLAWAVQGCLRWQREGLRLPGRVKAATAQYRATQDHLGRFLGDCCVIDDLAYVTAKALREAYEAWCGEQGERPWSAKAVGAELTNRGIDSEVRGPRDSRARTWLGIGLLSKGCERL